MSRNTVQKYVRELEYKALILTEPSKYESKEGQVRNGNLIYTILPIQGAIDCCNESQLWKGQALLSAARAVLGRLSQWLGKSPGTGA